MNLIVPALILHWKLAVPLDVLEHLEPWIRKIFAGRYAFLGFDRRCVLQWLEIWRTADLLYFEAREMIGWLEPGLLLFFFKWGRAATLYWNCTHTYIYITLIAMISVCCKVRWSMGCSNEGCPKLAERVMDLHSKQCIAILLIIVGFFPLHFLLIHGSGPDICNPRDPELVEGKTGKPSIWLVNDSCFRVKSFQQKQFILQHTDGNK